MAESTPDVISRYLRAADRKEIEALASCFAPEGIVVDEGITYRGHDQIVGWRQSLASTWEYTSALRRVEPAGPGEWNASVHIEGNFPGGQADLTYSFIVVDDKVSALSIVE